MFLVVHVGVSEIASYGLGQKRVAVQVLVSLSLSIHTHGISIYISFNMHT